MLRWLCGYPDVALIVSYCIPVGIQMLRWLYLTGYLWVSWFYDDCILLYSVHLWVSRCCVDCLLLDICGYPEFAITVSYRISVVILILRWLSLTGYLWVSRCCDDCLALYNVYLWVSRCCDDCVLLYCTVYICGYPDVAMTGSHCIMYICWYPDVAMTVS